MTINYTSLLLLVSSIVLSTTSFAQKLPHYSQYMMQQSIINPAAMGANKFMTGALLYKNQWTGMKGAPRIVNLDFTMPLTKQNYYNNNGTTSYIGINIVDDRIGVNVSDVLTASYAFRMQLVNNASLTFGLGAAIGVQKNRYSLIETSDPNDPMFGWDTPTLIMPNARAGVYYNTPKFYVGFAIPNLFTNYAKQTTGSFKSATMYNFRSSHYVLHAGTVLDLADNIKFTPSILVKAVGGAPIQADLNAQFLFNRKFGIGASFRTQKILIGLLNYRINDNISIGYAMNYDFTLLSKFSKGSHEILLQFRQSNDKSDWEIEDIR